MRIVGGHERDIHFGGHLEQLGIDPVLICDSVTLNLKVVAISKDPPKPFSYFPSGPSFPMRDRPRHRRRQAARCTDQTLVMRLEKIPIDPRLVVEAL